MRKLILILLVILAVWFLMGKPVLKSSSPGNAESKPARNNDLSVGTSVQSVGKSVQDEGRRTRTACCSGFGTTRCISFQAVYEKEKNEYDSKHSGLSPRLVLPNGMTVQEMAESLERSKEK